MRKYLFLIAELALIVFAIYTFQIERDQGLLKILPLILGGFILNLALPVRFRLPLFLALSLISFCLILGIAKAALVILIGLSLLSICHLPIAFPGRIALIILVGCLLAALRIGWIPTSWGPAVVPPLAAIFMFRLVLYLHNLKQKSPQPASIWHRLSYFFLLPNSCFLLFPVVDYQSFVRSYKTEDRLAAMQKGVVWMMRAVIHLLLYRVIYMYWVPSPSEVVDVSSLALFVLTSYALLLRISGQFYLSVGIISLFGFDLPAIFHNYYFATGFSDVWRRTYVYWKDFITKVFYYPIYFRLKKWGIRLATVISLVLVFFVTWILHSYQFFWLKGNFPLTAVDGIFWGIFAVALSVDSLLQLRDSKTKHLGPKQWNFGSALRRSIQWALCLSAICLMWSFWQSSTVEEWLNTVSVVQNISLSELRNGVLILLLVVLAGAFLQRLPFRNWSLLNGGFNKSVRGVALILIAILAFKFGASREPHIASFVATIDEPQLNRRDQQMNLKGYYEPLMTRESFVAQFQEGKIGDEEANFELKGAKLVRTNDLRQARYRPSSTFVLKGAEMRINRWGMRGKEYSLAKPSNTYRFAALGSSVEVGMGVQIEKTFLCLVEQRLNQTYAEEEKFEILNFAVTGYSIIRNTASAEEASKFHPDALLFFVHNNEERLILTNLHALFNEHVEIKELQRYLPRNSDKGMDYYEFSRRVIPHLPEIERWAFRKIASIAQRTQAIPICLQVGMGESQTENWSKLAKDNGFIFIDLQGFAGGRPVLPLRLGPWDYHFNNEGHRLVADYLYAQILNHQKELRLNLQGNVQ